jgi:hypothetical protein
MLSFLNFFLAKQKGGRLHHATMKHKSLLIALSSVTATAYAGTSYVAPAPAPAPEPVSCGWFLGGSFGQLYGVDSNIESLAEDGDIGSNLNVDDLDLNMYTLQVGRDLTNVNGWDVAAFLEVGYLEGDMSISAFDSIDGNLSTSLDFDIIPVTANIKVEHAIYGPVSGYLTAGAGYAWSKVEAEDQDENDGGFYAQASAGLIYNINESVELFGGARWLYLSDIGFGESEIELDDSFAWEIGARFNF